eukprot:CAMPEP_0113962878 /NCGR_PEP_ID=MMETSP0011_2-20120614/6188_1 /TAXON_ID=101924 /ORGANISM="Rhodosorus marinus" /LENGTH=228 /DNA_ID=CAMNT_0000974837 /DNA_START=306 /DNA_END=992 /DNA_ORIENTATION=- /assembly_acc=CAM_ASM_000156
MSSSGRTIKVDWFGDSIGMGFEMMTGPETPETHKSDPIKIGLEAALGKNPLDLRRCCLPARTINLDDPSLPHFSTDPEAFNCAKAIDSCFAERLPNYAVLQLGTNDLRKYHGQTVEQVGDAMAEMIDSVKDVCMPIVVAPPLMNFRKKLKSNFLEPYYGNCENSPSLLSKLYKALARQKEVGFYDATRLGNPGAGDGVHLDWDQSCDLGYWIGREIMRIDAKGHQEQF